MTWIDALKYGLTALAALFGFWAVTRIKAQPGAASEASSRVIKSLMIFSVVLLLLSGLLALYEGFFLQGKRLREMRPILARLDQTLADKLSIDNDAFAPLDAHSKQIVDNMIRQLCRDLTDLYSIAAAGMPSRCRARLDRPPAEG
jgi:hypothetical protein